MEQSKAPYREWLMAVPFFMRFCPKFIFRKERTGGEMDKKKCKECLWKTTPGKDKIVCLFPHCIFENKKKEEKKKN